MGIILYGCPPSNYINENCSAGYHTFNILVNFEPTNKVIPFGDTISISSVIPRELISNESSEIFDFDSIKFRPIVTFAKLDTPFVENFKYYPFTDFFDFFVDSIYNLRINGNSISLEYYYSGEDYFLKFKFIPKRKGIYYFQFTSAYLSHSNYDNVPIIYSLDSNCETNKWLPYFNTNSDNNHKELLKESIYEYSRNDMYEKWDQNYFIYGKHCFKVE